METQEKAVKSSGDTRKGIEKQWTTQGKAVAVDDKCSFTEVEWVDVAVDENDPRGALGQYHGERRWKMVKGSGASEQKAAKTAVDRRRRAATT